MNSDDLTLFARVARDLSISRTALFLGLDQSTVSRRIAVLEGQVGGALFRRSGHGVRLTERGKTLLEHADRVTAALGEAVRAMRLCSQSGPPSLCVAAQPTIARMLFPLLARLIRDRYPATRLRFVEGLASGLLERLQEGEIDLAILYVPEHPGAFHWDNMLEEEVRLITPAGFRHSGPDFDVRNLDSVSLILPSTHHGLRMLVEKLGSRYGFTPNVVLECDGSNGMTIRMVKNGFGCTILPSAAVNDEIMAGTVKSFRLSNPDVKRTIAVTWPRKSLLNDDLTEIIRTIHQAARELVKAGQWLDARLHDGKAG